MCRNFVFSTFVLIISWPATAVANQCFGADGAFGFQDSFALDEIVYLSGDFDTVTRHLVCGDGDLYLVRHGDPGLEDVTRGGANYQTGCTLGGGFFDAPVWLPLLEPGSGEV